MQKIRGELHEEDKNIKKMRTYVIVKSNDLIQKSRFNLSLQEQKIILYLISKIKPKEMELKEHTFEIRDFCRICGLDDKNGANYKHIKQTLKELRDKSIWVTLNDGSETIIAWLDWVTMNKNSGAIIIKIHERMKPYLLHLQDNFTQYELLYILAMKSRYSVRLYEILKSYAYQHRKVLIDLDELKKMIYAENYTRFPDFKRYVLDISVREINDFSDLIISYEIIKQGRRYAKIEFSMKTKKSINQRLQTWAKIEEVINPAQTSLFNNDI